MADSLVDMVLGAVNPDVVTKLAQGVGINPDQAQSVVNNAVPAMLGGLASTAMSADGAKKIADAVANQDPSVTDDPLAATGGSDLLGSLLGGDKVDQIAQAVAGSSGTSANVVKSMMGTITPAMMGVMGQQDPSTWSSPTGIMNMLAGQKDAIAAALPAGMGNLLGMGGAAMGAAGGMAAAARNAMPTGGSNAPSGNMGSGNAGSGGGIPSWVWAVLALIVLGGLYYYFTGNKQEAEMSTPAPAATETSKAATPAPAAPAAPAESAPAAAPAAPAPAATMPAITKPAMPALPDVAGLTKQATDALDGVKTTLGSVTDAASATAALPKLEAANASLDKIDGLVTALPASAKGPLVAAVAPTITEVNGLMDKASAMPGVGDTLKPALDTLKAKLTALSGS